MLAVGFLIRRAAPPRPYGVTPFKGSSGHMAAALLPLLSQTKRLQKTAI